MKDFLELLKYSWLWYKRKCWNGVNNVNYYVDATLGSVTIGFLGEVGYRKVWKFNPPDELKENIKNIIEEGETIKNSYETIEKLRDIINYSESLK